MKRRVILVCILAVGFFAQPNKSASQNAGGTEQQAGNPASAQDNHKPTANEHATKVSTPQWYTSSEWWLVIIAALTGIAIAYQAREMARATNVMQRQAVLLEHQINKERAHIRFEIKSFDPKYPETEEDNALQEINFSVKVFGTAYAFIDSSDFAAKITDSDEFIEIEPSVLKEWDFWGFATVPDIAPPGTPIIEGETPFTLTRFEVDSLFHGKSFIHFSVKILYHDFTQIQRETRAYYLWTSRGLNKQGKVIGYGSWKKIGPPEANRET